uniref:Uncharacterized protein n=1 Tax=Mimiviridae sp. ChoanoV1 TaxID=2596887 RepID=A0A5B8IDG5_9VIRU|nr:hypothetical protein 1_181 [Mimiviridae sp. ChoanoV1]
MKKYSIIGNCQGGVLNIFLRTNKYFVNNYEYIGLGPIQILSKEKIDNF